MIKKYRVAPHHLLENERLAIGYSDKLKREMIGRRKRGAGTGGYRYIRREAYIEREATSEAG